MTTSARCSVHDKYDNDCYICKVVKDITWESRVKNEVKDPPEWLMSWARSMDNLDKIEENINVMNEMLGGK